ncbi:hypothetical protein J3A65_001053 [Rhizobium sp. PvP014]|nr:hypothetical protein [Rhizobium sp. PvP014]MBP2527686.1 hypothetical protein [Rhizobium sp. PvP099]
MKAVPRRDVYRHDKFILEKQLDPDKIEQRELLALVIIDKQIEIAVGSGFVAGNRAEQIKRGRAERPDRVGLPSQLLDRLCFF